MLDGTEASASGGLCVQLEAGTHATEHPRDHADRAQPGGVHGALRRGYGMDHSMYMYIVLCVEVYIYSVDISKMAFKKEKAHLVGGYMHYYFAD